MFMFKYTNQVYALKPQIYRPGNRARKMAKPGKICTGRIKMWFLDFASGMHKETLLPLYVVYFFLNCIAHLRCILKSTIFSQLRKNL